MKCNLKKINFTKFKNITPRAITIQVNISEASMEEKYIYNENTPSVKIILTLFEGKYFHKDRA